MIEREGETIRIYASRRKGIVVFGVLSLLTLAMHAFNQLGWTEGTEIERGYVYGLFFCSVVALVLTIFKKTILEINPAGIKVFRGLLMPLHVVPWAHIKHIGPVGKFDWFIGVEVKPEFKDFHGRIGSLSGYEILIPCVRLNGDEQMLDLLKARWEQATRAENA